MKSFFLLNLLFFLFLSSASAKTANMPLAVQNYSSEEYKSGSQNWAVATLWNGNVVFGNSRGLLVFDSYNWCCYPVGNKSTIRTIYVKGENIYVGASDEIGYFREENEGMVYYSLSHLLPKNKALGEIWNIFEYNGQLVFVSKVALLLYNKEKESITTVDATERIESSAVIDGKIYIGTDHGVYVVKESFDEKLFKFEPLTKNQSILKGQTIKKLIPYNGKILIFSTESAYSYNGIWIEEFEREIHPYLKEKNIFSATLNGDILAIGTVRGGVVIRNLKEKTTQYVTTANGLQNNTVISIISDAIGNLWCGEEDGVSYVIIDMPDSPLLPQNNIGTGYISHLYKGKLFLGTNQGLFYLDYPIKNNGQPRATQGIDGQIWTMTVIDNRLYCCADHGIFTIDISPIDGCPVAEKIDETIGSWILIKLRSAKDMLIGLDYAGLFTINEKTREVRRIPSFPETSNRIKEDSDSTIWIPHWQKGIYHIKLTEDLDSVAFMELYNAENQIPTTANNDVCVIDGKIYLSCTDGIYYLDKATDSLKRDELWTTRFVTKGFPLKIKQIPNGDFWAEKEEYLAFVTKNSDGEYVVDSVTFNTMRQTMQTDLGDYTLLDDSTTLFNTKKGFTIAKNNKKITKNPYNVAISSISTISEEKHLYRATENNDETLIVDKADNSLHIEFVFPEYRKSNAINYQCYLEGYDYDYISLGTINYKEYTRLPKGEYIFHIKGENQLTGQTSENSIKIKILPAWWETTTAEIGYFAVFILIFYQIRKIISRRDKLELEREKDDKITLLREQKTKFDKEKKQHDYELLVLRNEQLSSELKHKSGELADSTINIIRKNDILMSIDNQMVELSKEESLKEVQQKIVEIRHEIKIHLTEDNNWGKFEENFNLVYDDFIKKLLVRFPSLKMGDQKLCAYIRMGLSSKEIASLLNTTERSIETARYRLRKKLELDKEGSQNIPLKDFLQTIE